MSGPFDRGRGKGIPFYRLVCVSIVILLSVSMLTMTVGQASAKSVYHPDPMDPSAQGDPLRYTYTREDITATYRLLDAKSIEEMKETIGVRQPGVDYNLMVDSMGTGLAPPSEEEWTAMEGEVRVVEGVESTLGTGSSFDLSTEPYFPQVRSQGSQGSCAAWAMTYYAYGYLEAKANGWTEASTGNNSQLMSPAWTYNKVNGGSDGGSSMQRNGQIIVEWGAATWATMPYNPNDAVSWGNEAAWREAPQHRAVDVYSISFNPSTSVDTVKNLVASGVPVTFAMDAYQYSNGFSDGNYIISSSEYSSNTVNHANTIVGFDDTISDDGDVGAFRVVNSWGSNWGDNGFYWLTYSAFNEIGNLLFLRYIETRADHTPSLLAVWQFNDAPTRNADLRLGIGTVSSPIEVREPYYGKNTGTNVHRFPTFMCLDISEFREEFDGGANSFYLLFGEATYAGTISSFKLEMYEMSYYPGAPTQVSAQSSDVPKATPGHVTNQFSHYQHIPLATALDNQSLSLSTGGLAGWVGVQDQEAYGGDAVRSGGVGDSGTSWMRLDIHGPGEIEFRWKVSSEEGKDILRFLVNGMERAAISGQTPWEALTFEFGEGINTLEWRYTKDGANSALQDCGWVDRVVISAGAIEDDTPPSVSITSPAQDSWKRTSTVTVEWIGSDTNSGIDRFEISRNGQAFTDLGTSQSYTYSSLSNGLHEVVVRAFDKAGNVAEDSVTFGVDTLAPSLTIGSPTQGQIMATNSVTITWQGSDSTSGIDYYQVRLDSGLWIGVGGATSHTFSSLSEGQHVAYVRAADIAGNTVIKSRSFIVDTCEPMVEITAPSGGGAYGYVLQESEVEIGWTASDSGTGISHFEIQLNGGQWVSIGKAFSHTYDGLSEGQHTVTVRAHDLAGNIGSDSVTFIVDTVAPDLSIISPQNNAILATASVTLEWVGSDVTSGLIGYGVRLNSDGWVDVGLTSTYTFSSLSQGSHILSVRATDAAGNVAMKSISIIVDSIAPTVSIISPDNGSYINQTSVEVTWEGSDSGTGISNYWIRLNSGSWIDVGTSTSHRLTLTNGDHRIQVKAVDGAGNTALDEVRVVVDDRPLWVYILSPLDGTAVGNESPVVTWSGSGSAFGVAYYEIRLNDGQWQQVGLLTSHQLSDLQDGAHLVHVRIVDNSGNSSEDMTEFMVDTTPPSLSVITPPDGFSAVSSVVLEWEATDDGSGLLECLVSLDGGEWLSVGEGFTHTFTGLSEGEHTVVIRAVDRVGNWAEESVNFIVDLAPPSIVIHSPTQGMVTDQSTISFSWTIGDSLSGVGVSEYRLNDGPWISIYPSGSMTITSLGEGHHTLFVRATDGAGNSHTTSVSFLVDGGESLAIWILAPADGEMLGSSGMRLEWSSQCGQAGIVGYAVSLNGGGWIDMGVSTSTVIDLEEGAHEIWVRVIDGAGNVAMDSVSVTLDLTPPNVSWIDVPGPYVNQSQSELRWNGSDDLTGMDRFDLWANGVLVLSGMETSFPLATLADGEHDLLLRAYDLVGNVAEIVLSLHLDTTPPDLTIEQGSVVMINRTSIAISWVGIDEGSGILGYEIRMGEGVWMCVGSATDHLFDLEGEGVYPIQIRAVDRAGNINIGEVEVMVDMTAPTVVEHSPTARSSMSLESIYVLFSEEMDPETLEVTVEGASGYHTYQDRELIFVLTSPLASGITCTVKVQGNDLAGNPLEPFTWSFEVEHKVTLKGLVVGNAGIPVTGATVVLSDGQSCLTSFDGRFAIDVPPGIYEVKIIAEGFNVLSLSIYVEGPGAYDMGELWLVQENDGLLEMLVEPPVIAVMAAGMASIIGMGVYIRRQ